MDNAAQKLQSAYEAAAIPATVREIGPGYYEVVKSRLRQTITHRDLCNEIERLKLAPAYGEWCRNPDACKGKGYCPLDPTCGD